ncbi:MAG: XRE family transcriptional regulator [Acidobacteria bacterium]|nr:XRE family transcriptional regulator [Acidobacteriota bacterium]
MEGARFNPEMVVLARSYRGRTQQDLAQALGATQATVSRVEHGLLEPRQPFVESLAKALEVPPSFFFQPGHLYALPIRPHRRRKQIAQGTMKRIHAEITLRAMHLGKLLRAAELESRCDVPEFDLDDLAVTPEEAARRVREQWRMPQGPIPNLMAVLENAGVVVVLCDFGSPDMDALGIRIPGLPPLMFIHRDLPVDRMRWTLAHELGHLVLHSLPREDMEREADRFAAELTMPEADIRPQLRRLTLQRLVLLERVWRVSMVAILRRAEQLKTIGVRVAKGLWKDFSASGWRRREPPEHKGTPEEPTRLRALIAFHQAQRDYSLEMLCRALHLFVHEFPRLYPSPGKAEQPANRKPAKKPGPEADRLVIEGDWEAAVKKAMKRPNPRTPEQRKATP